MTANTAEPAVDLTYYTHYDSAGHEVRLDDTYISSFHARIFRRDDGWYVEDLGSTNGTYLNQRRVTSPAELHAGDRLKIGKMTLELRR